MKKESRNSTHRANSAFLRIFPIVIVLRVIVSFNTIIQFTSENCPGNPNATPYRTSDRTCTDVRVRIWMRKTEDSKIRTLVKERKSVSKWWKLRRRMASKDIRHVWNWKLSAVKRLFTQQWLEEEEEKQQPAVLNRESELLRNEDLKIKIRQLIIYISFSSVSFFTNYSTARLFMRTRSWIDLVHAT